MIVGVIVSIIALIFVVFACFIVGKEDDDE